MSNTEIAKLYQVFRHYDFFNPERQCDLIYCILADVFSSLAPEVQDMLYMIYNRYV